jgi:methionine synthase II (cobalamin-independent)
MNQADPARGFGWPAGATTGIGSLPGTEPAEALRLVLGEVAELPYLPELPARGVGADLIGRGCAMLVDLPTEYLAHGWTLTSHGGRDLARARDHLARDLDLLTELAVGVPSLKIAVPGPLTLAAGVELANLHKVLTDPGAFRDLAGSLAEGVRLLLASLADRLPGTDFVLQVDEPSLPAVLAGRIPTPSGYGTVRAVPRSVAEPLLAAVLAAAGPGRRVVHCCAAEVPYELIRSAGADAISVDAFLITDAHLDSIGSLVEGGGSLWLGVVPGTDAEISLSGTRDSVRSLWNKLGFSDELLAERVVLTPSCGLAGASMGYVRRAISVLRDAGSALREQAL